jgi:hypothetical protein
MSKILVLAVALSIVLGGGAFFKAQAAYGDYHSIQSPPLYGCVSCKIAGEDRDTDLAPVGYKGNNEWERDMLNGPVSPY